MQDAYLKSEEISFKTEEIVNLKAMYEKAQEEVNLLSGEFGPDNFRDELQGKCQVRV